MDAYLNEFYSLLPGVATDVGVVIAGSLSLWFVYAGVRWVMRIFNATQVRGEESREDK
jgi:hypothetical protein